MVDDRRRPRYPTWVRAVLVGLQVLGVVVGVVVGNLTYSAWSEPDAPAVPTTTVVAPAEPEAPVTETPGEPEPEAPATEVVPG